jgi:hypothetical protein
LQSNYTFYINGKWTKNINYVIIDPLTCNNINIYKYINHYIKQGNYGIEAEYNGIVLIAKGYSGKPLIYGPENRYFSASQMATSIPDARSIKGTISSSYLIGNETLWYGPYTYLQPGNYSLTLHLKASNNSSQNSFTLRYSYMLNPATGTPIDIQLFTVTGKNFTQANKWENVTTIIHADNFLDYVEFAGQGFHWQGNVSISAIYVKQISS